MCLFPWCHPAVRHHTCCEVHEDTCVAKGCSISRVDLQVLRTRRVRWQRESLEKLKELICAECQYPSSASLEKMLRTRAQDAACVRVQ